MKILFHSIGKTRKIEKADENHKWEWKTDYQLDSLFHGLRSVLGEDLVDTPEFDHMYKENLGLLHKDNPKRFTLFGKIDACNIDRNDILEKVQKKYFDYVILGLHHADEIDDEDLKEVELFKKSKLVIIHGGDNGAYNEKLLRYGPVFKRELYQNPNNKLHPISFSIPKELIVNDVPEKKQSFGTVIPSFMHQHTYEKTYIFENEEDYLNDYKKSLFGLTFKKGGWDCLRHYEILASGCLPYFWGLQECPPQTLQWLPKSLLLDVMRLPHVEIKTLSIDQEKFNFNLYGDLLLACIQYTKKKLTTEFMAKYVLDTIKKTY